MGIGSILQEAPTQHFEVRPPRDPLLQMVLGENNNSTIGRLCTRRGPKGYRNECTPYHRPASILTFLCRMHRDPDCWTGRSCLPSAYVFVPDRPLTPIWDSADKYDQPRAVSRPTNSCDLHIHWMCHVIHLLGRNQEIRSGQSHQVTRSASLVCLVYAARYLASNPRHTARGSSQEYSRRNEIHHHQRLSHDGSHNDFSHYHYSLAFRALQTRNSIIGASRPQVAAHW
ncbi:hypothetical protein ARMSODRAFT_1085140 [Armillaria solidipes]|uniref:Uncharacterized protein n=1 Tax=Armillaria solidipes TaxID=1076256 RepID=A0A2H3BNY9_9AGAR|nr:hypothetical protein ARMSODRAFT_1085140 [Armillaria solidipes]